MPIYLLVTQTAHAIPLSPIYVLWDVKQVDVTRLDEAFEQIAKAILSLSEKDYILIQAGLPALCSFATLMLYQRFQRVKIAQFNVETRQYHIYTFPKLRNFL